MMCSYSIIFGQKSKHSLSLYTRYAYGEPDTRYDFLYAQYPILIIEGVQTKLKDVTYDDEYFLGISYNYQLVNRLNLGIGVGYAQLQQDFSLPADGNSYFNLAAKPSHKMTTSFLALF